MGGSDVVACFTSEWLLVIVQGLELQNPRNKGGGFFHGGCGSVIAVLRPLLVLGGALLLPAFPSLALATSTRA